ncbi:MAG: hypothetical protein DRI86_07680 [Bacteroidetes bacterium]|nr:MAG: hypothetical protein DRI86_07680 [Bacteroidota bacterium]
MKKLRFIVLGLSIGFVGVALTSCEPMSDCKSCEVVTYQISTGAELDRQPAIEFCGSDLDSKENSLPVISGDERTVWECN